MDTVESYLRPALQTAQDALVTVVDSLQLRKDAPFSPDIPKELLESMPDLSGRLLLTFPWTKPRAVDPSQHSVWIFDNTAYRVQPCAESSSCLHISLTDTRSQDKKVDKHKADPRLIAAPNEPLPRPYWEVEYVAAYFSHETCRDASHVMADIARLVGLVKGTASEEECLGKLKDITAIKQRLEPFLNPILPRHTIRVKIADTETQTLGPSTSSGISSDLLRLHFDAPSGTQLTTTADSDPSPCFAIPSRTVLAEPTGWGVISDIDDTIKITGTLSPVAVLKSTFIDAPTPVTGMPELYTDLVKLLADPIFFYLSGSPYNLYPFLRSFRKDHFPDGTMILRDASWQNLGGLISSLSINVQEYKVDRLEKMHTWFPDRQFICVGDSTQKDPESYAEIARRHPGWIKAIYIRRVPDENEIQGALNPTRNSNERFETAFKELDPKMWLIFDEPDEVRKNVQLLVR
jgi:phosphatidate phosphatase APP1